MGQPKLLLPWNATSVVGHLIAQWQELGAERIAVVCAGDDHALNAELDRLRFSRENRIVNPTRELGMFGSVQCAARWPRWCPGLTHWAIVLGDQPHLKGETLRTLLEFASAHSEKICQPLWQGRRRHPVVLPKRVINQLGVSRESDLKTFLEPLYHERAFCEIDDPGLGIDIDHPSDYEQARKLSEGKK